MPPDVELARAQAALVLALVGNGSPPAGFAPERLDAAALILLRKRRTAVARAAPFIVHALGRSYASRFNEFARASASSVGRDSLGDALAFTWWLRRRSLVPARLLILLLKLRLRHVGSLVRTSLRRHLG